jgi:hypothetical protein
MFPDTIQFQTHSFCSGSCPFCPYWSLTKYNPQGKMPTTLIKKIIDECAEHHIFRMIPYLMNEPLMDPRIVTIVKYIEKKMPDAIIEMSTNGRHFNRWMLEEFSKVKKLVLLVTVQETTPDILDTWAKMPEYTKALLYKDYMAEETYMSWKWMLDELEIDWKDGVVDDRAGNLPLIDDGQKRWEDGVCMNDRINTHFHILWTGEVILCCQDWRRIHKAHFTVVNNSIKTIFNSLPYDGWRRSKPALCNRCARWLPT